MTNAMILNCTGRDDPTRSIEERLWTWRLDLTHAAFRGGHWEPIGGEKAAKLSSSDTATFEIVLDHRLILTSRKIRSLVDNNGIHETYIEGSPIIIVGVVEMLYLVQSN